MMGFELFGPLLIAFGLSLMMVTPLHLTLARSKPHAGRSASFLRGIYPPAAPNAELERLVAEAGQAIDTDPLIRATAEIADTYDQA